MVWFPEMYIQKAMFERWRKVSSGISDRARAERSDKSCGRCEACLIQRVKQALLLRRAGLPKARLRGYSLQTFHRNVCKMYLASSLEQGEAVLFASPNPSCRLDFPLSPRARRMAQGVSPSADGDQGRCPWTLQAF